MTRSTRSIKIRTLVVPAVAAFALVLTGCSGDGKAAAAEDSPLQKYLGQLWDDTEWSQETLDAQTLKTEEYVAKCMSKQGFEYTPNTQNGGTITTSGGDEDGPEWGSVEFAKQYGYGIIDSPGIDEGTDDGDVEEYFDPNEKYVSSLSESEQEAYYEALHGPQPTEEEWAEMEENGDSFEYDWKTAGCYGEAQHKTQTDQDAYTKASEDPEFEDLFAEIDALYNDLWSDEGNNEDVAAINSEWSTCMTGKGQDAYNSPAEAQQKLYDEMSELQLPGGESGEWKELSDAENKKFQEREIKVAVADAECQAKVKYTDNLAKIQTKLEQGFIDENKAQLDKLVATYGIKKK